MRELEPEPGAESPGVGDPEDEPRIVEPRAPVVPRIQFFLVILAEDGEVEERLLGREEPEVVGGEAVERGALAVVPVLRRHHGRAELLGDDGQVVVGDAVAGGLAADAQEHRPRGVVVVVEELEVALLELAMVAGGEVVEALAHPALLPRQVSARGGRELAAGGPRAVAEPERLGAAREEEEEGGAEEGGEPSAGHHFFRLLESPSVLPFPSHCRVFVLERDRAGSRFD